MPKEKGSKGETKSIYLDGRTAELARQVLQQTGQHMSEFVRQALINASYSINDSQQLIDKVDKSELASTEQYIGISIQTYPLFNLDDDRNLDKWIFLDSTKKVFLMGTTMRNPIVDYLAFWRKFLEGGKSLHVLLQGNLGTDEESPSYTPLKNQTENVSEKRMRALQALGELGKVAPEHSLVVRRTDGFLISHSAIIVYGKENPLDVQPVDIQIQPFIFPPEDYGGVNSQFLVRTQTNSLEYSLLVAPIARLWERSIIELQS